MKRTYALIWIVVLVCLVCGGVLVLGSVRLIDNWGTHWQALIPPGAHDVQVARRTPMDTRVTYRLPSGQSLHHVSRFLRQQGWRRALLQRTEPQSRTMLFMRRNAWGHQREIIHVYAQPHGVIEMSVGRCFTVGSFTYC